MPSTRHDSPNPFDVVKATDFTDGQILNSFVDLPALPNSPSFIDRLSPTSRMPMFIFGGKGSGKTHLMRYLSHPLQTRRHAIASVDGVPGDLLAHLRTDGYLGLYIRAGGLNAQRFQGKGQPEDTWIEVFAFYMELWLSQLLLTVLSETLLVADQAIATEAALVTEIQELLDIPPDVPRETLADVTALLAGLQRTLDIAINNSAITRRLDVQIAATRGKLIFGIPRIVAAHCTPLKDILFLYLIDEFENLTESQQRYVNTLLRERQEPCSFKVGVRLYGLRTMQTLAAGEENREGSEYQALRLDTELRKLPHGAQVTFAKNLIERRLSIAGFKTSANTIEEMFEEDDETESLRSHSRRAGRVLPHIQRLRAVLTEAQPTFSAAGLSTQADIDLIVNVIQFPHSLFLERVNTMLLYRAWAKGTDLQAAARAIAADAQKYNAGERKDTLHEKLLKHFRSDVAAQLRRELHLPQLYVGLDNFIRMSAGLPRCLLTLLKYAFTWSRFYGEEPFKKERISIAAQSEAVKQASEWFFADARAPGPEGAAIRDSMTRLGQLLRTLRYADKPSECSLSSFSADVTTTPTDARRLLELAEEWSMIIAIEGGQADRNAGRIDRKYQIHPMLAPRWDLPIARRGAVALSGAEIGSIFSAKLEASFKETVERRESLATAPFFGHRKSRERRLSQTSLMGIDDDVE